MNNNRQGVNRGLRPLFFCLKTDKSLFVRCSEVMEVVTGVDFSVSLSISFFVRNKNIANFSNPKIAHRNIILKRLTMDFLYAIMFYKRATL